MRLQRHGVKTLTPYTTLAYILSCQIITVDQSQIFEKIANRMKLISQLSQQRPIVSNPLLLKANVEVSCGPDEFRICTAFYEKPQTKSRQRHWVVSQNRIRILISKCE